MFAPELIADCRKTLVELDQDPYPVEGPVLGLLDRAKLLAKDAEAALRVEEIRQRNPSGLATLEQHWAPYNMTQARWFGTRLKSISGLNMELPPKERLLEFLDSAAMEMEGSGVA